MERTTIERIRRALRSDLGNAEDNLRRARAAFRNTDLDGAHGESGKTRRQIVSEYESWKEQAQFTIDDFDAALPQE